MKKLILFASIVLCACGFVFAADNFADFNQANDLYSKGQYEQAAAAYENIIAGKTANAALYYNLGNAYYKTQHFGRAVLNFERAMRLKPLDADIRFNLNFLRNMVKEPSEPFPEILLTYINNLLSLNELSVLCSLFYFLLIAGIIIYIVTKQQNALVFNATFLIGVIVFSGWLLIKINKEVLSHEAIIITGSADVRNGPGIENSVGFTLPEGRKVLVLGAKDDWAAIGLKSEGLKGWIEKKYLEEI